MRTSYFNVLFLCTYCEVSSKWEYDTCRCFLCMVQTWYLACDFHFFLIAVPIIFLTMKLKKLGITLFLLCFLLSLLVPFAITLMHSKQAMARMYPELLRIVKAHPDFMSTYIKSHNRANAYFVGMVAGYIYYELKNSEGKFSRVKSHLLTMTSVLLIIVAFISSVPFFDPYHGYNVIEHAIFAALYRLPWSLGTVGLILTASYGHASIIRKIFSWSPFVPLSKLSYAAYLVQITFQYRSLGQTTASATFNIFTLITTTFADIVVSFITALVLHIVVEMPIRKLIKGLLMNKTYVIPLSSETITLREEAANANGSKLNDRIELQNLSTVEK